MIRVAATIGTLFVIFLTKDGNTGSAFQPEFAEPIVNLSIAIGRDATFRCLVHHLGGYRVGWVKADTKAIQAIHDHVITHNPRVSVSHNDHTTWNLHIRSVQEEDRGQYMCQINTDPMKSQVGSLDVVVPPDFINEETSGDVMIPEGGTVKLSCRARGYPEPHVLWRREDGHDIIIRESIGMKSKVITYQGEILRLAKVSRTEMGAYMCIASNGVPPTVSKRIMVNVNFPPVIQVPNQLVGAPLGTSVSLECHVEASPKAINYWVRDTGEMVISSDKNDVQVLSRSMFEVRMTVVIKDLQPDDFGSYRCIAKNSLGEVESSIRLYEIPGPTRKITPNRGTDNDDDDDDDEFIEQFGSAEHETYDSLPPVQKNTRISNAAGQTIPASAAQDTRHSDYVENHVPVDPPPLSGGSGSRASAVPTRVGDLTTNASTRTLSELNCVIISIIGLLAQVYF